MRLPVIDTTPPRRLLKIFASLFAVAVSLTACADRFPVPGGTSAVNQNCFNDIADMQTRLLSMTPGMKEGEVFTRLCQKRESMTRLQRGEIRIALLGGPDVQFANDGTYSDSQIIQSLYGYRLSYKSVKSVHGFTNPIRIRTNETGYDYTVTLIFQDGKLYAKPMLTGGLVNNVTSGTLFDLLTAGTLVSLAPK